jgi:hypothetical protein
MIIVGTIIIIALLGVPQTTCEPASQPAAGGAGMESEAGGSSLSDMQVISFCITTTYYCISTANSTTARRCPAIFPLSPHYFITTASLLCRRLGHLPVYPGRKASNDLWLSVRLDNLARRVW